MIAIADRIAALAARPVVTLVAGAALFYAVGHWLGWWVVLAIAAAGIGDTAFAAVQLLRGGRAS